jgi:hypothetical protein
MRSSRVNSSPAIPRSRSARENHEEPPDQDQQPYKSSIDRERRPASAIRRRGALPYAWAMMQSISYPSPVGLEAPDRYRCPDRSGPG